MTIGLPYGNEICLKIYKNISVEQKSTWRGSSVKKKETLQQTGVSCGRTDHAIRYQYAGTDLSDVGGRRLAGQTFRNELLDDPAFLYGSSGRRAECIPYGQDNL